MAHSSSLAKMKSPQTTAIEALQRRTDTARATSENLQENRDCTEAVHCNAMAWCCRV